MYINEIAALTIMTVAILMVIISCILIKEKIKRLYLMITTICILFFSGLGIVVNNIHDNYSFMLSYILFLIFTVISAILVFMTKKTSINSLEKNQNLFLANRKIFIILGIICLISEFSSLIFPNFRLFDIFKLPEFKADSGVFEKKTLLNNDQISWLMGRVKVLTLPFFFIWLYTLRKKPLKFMLLFFIFNYIDVVENNYISRSAIAVNALFIWIYLYIQNVFNRKALRLILLILIILSVPASYIYFFSRIGIDISFDLGQYWALTWELILSESYSQQFLSYADETSDQLIFVIFILSSVTSPLFFLPDVNFPVLSYLFTETILGLQYGARDYYIMLPGAFGEGVMIFGKNFGWLYGVFIGIYTTVVFLKIRDYPFLKFWLVYFLLDYIRAYRGGIQTFFIASINTMILLVIIILLLKFIAKRKTTQNEDIISSS